jgi:hypothetical protein
MSTVDSLDILLGKAIKFNQIVHWPGEATMESIDIVESIDITELSDEELDDIAGGATVGISICP